MQRPGDKLQFIEAWVFLLLIVPSMILSLGAVRQGHLEFPLVAISVIARDLGLLALVLFFLWRNREPWPRLGWTSRAAGREAILGALLFLPFFFGIAGLEWLLHRLGLPPPPTKLPAFLAAADFPQLVLAFVLVVVVAITEETIFRGYLLLRFTPMLGSTPRAVLWTAAVFAIGHGYEGTTGVVTVGAMGVVLALVYLWRRSLVAPVVMHFLQDFLILVVVPLLKLK